MAKAGIWGFYTQGKERVGELPPPPHYKRTRTARRQDGKVEEPWASHTVTRVTRTAFPSNSTTTRANQPHYGTHQPMTAHAVRRSAISPSLPTNLIMAQGNQ